MTLSPRISEISGTTIAITGGAGFIGSMLASRLSEDPTVSVVLFDNLHHDVVTDTPLLRRPNVRLVRGDVRDRQALAEALRGANHILHMASIAGVDTVMKQPVLLSAAQIAAFKGAYDNNARPVQPINGRPITVDTSKN